MKIRWHTQQRSMTQPQKGVSRILHKTATSGKTPIFGDLGSVEYPFIAITPRCTLTQGGSTC